MSAAQGRAVEPIGSAPLALLGVAERLFGQHGIEGVSMRQITLAAQLANNSAIAYHFGDREGLLRAIANWRLGAIETCRRRMLALAEADGEGHDPRRIVQILVRPVLAIRAEDGAHPHAAFVCQLLRTRLGREIRRGYYGSDSVVDEMVRRLAAHVPDMPPALLAFRIRIGALAYYDAVVERDQMARDDPARLDLADAAFLAELDGLLLAMVLRPTAG